MLTKYLIFLILLLSCHSTGSKAEYGDSAPDWVHTSSLHDGYYWGVGYSEGKRSPIEAKKEAVANGKSKLAEIMESRISSSVEVVYKSIEGIDQTTSQQSIYSEIKVKSFANLRKVVIDRTHYIKQPNGAYEYYVLVKVSEKEFIKKMEKLQRKYLEKIASVDGNLKKGKALLKKGLVGPAVNRFIYAAINSTRVPDRVNQFQDIVLLIQKTLKNIRFKKINDRQKGTLKGGLAKPVKVQLIYHSGSKRIPVRKTALRFYLKRNGGSRYDKTAVTNRDGMAQSRVRSFKRGGNNVKMMVRLDLTIALDGFDHLVSKKWRAEKAIVEEAVDEAQTFFHFVVQ
ncbi:MAG: hypothetical protein IEMM0008_1860 [bacterium]|nr:MAG: hypothetical protein IEMM0008_1860 [bacterium]